MNGGVGSGRLRMGGTGQRVVRGSPGEERIGWLVAPGLALIAVTYGLARYAYGLFLPEMREAFDLTPAMLGVIGAGSYLGYCVAIVFALVWTSRTGPRWMAVAAGIVAGGWMGLGGLSPPGRGVGRGGVGGRR